MKLNIGDSRLPCRNCGREHKPAALDRRLWCPDCRGEVVRRSAIVARITAFVFALGLAFWIYTLVGSAPRFLIIFVAMVVAAYFFVYKLTQRVAFEVIRSRGVPPPPPPTDETNG